jgi:DNA alkylation repair enzyme
MPVLREVCRDVFADVDLPDAAAWHSLVLSIWREAAYREERYAAIELTGDRRASSFQTPDAVPMYEELIVTGAWWDYVDPIASRRLGPILRRNQDELRRLMLTWARDANSGAGGPRSSASSAPKSRPTPNCSRRASHPRSARRSSSCARASAGRCASTPRPTPTGCGRTCACTTGSCRGSRSERRPDTFRRRLRHAGGPPAYVSCSTCEPPTIASRPSGNRTHALWVPS